MSFGAVTVRASFILTLAFIIYLDKGGLIWVIWTAAALHELGHFAAVLFFGGKLEKLELSGAGANMIVAPSGRMGYGSELIAVLAGPVASLVFALIFSLYGDIVSICYPLSGMCLGQGLFNLLPVDGLDGGRALRLCLILSGVEREAVITRVAGYCCMALTLCAGIWVAWRSGGDFSLIVVCVWLTMPLLNKVKD